MEKTIVTKLTVRVAQIAGNLLYKGQRQVKCIDRVEGQRLRMHGSGFEAYRREPSR